MNKYILHQESVPLLYSQRYLFKLYFKEMQIVYFHNYVLKKEANFVTSPLYVLLPIVRVISKALKVKIA